MITANQNSPLKTKYQARLPVLILNEAGEPVSRINLDEWGNMGPMTIGSKAEINYTGKKMDRNTGLFYFNQRYYDPELGRFITHDPAGQGLNPYAYCGNSPLLYVDPDGEWFDDVLKTISGGLTVGAAGKDYAGKMLGAGIGLIGKDLSQQQTWNGFVGDIVFMARAYLAYTSGFGFEFGETWYLNALESGLNYGSTNVAQGILSGEHMSWEHTGDVFGQGFVQGAGIYLGGRLIEGASPTFLKEYGFGTGEIKAMITGDIKGYVMARGLNFGFEHFQVFYKEGVNLANHGVIGKGNHIFGPAKVGEEISEVRYLYRKVRALTQRELTKVLESIDRTGAGGYVMPFNNCVHACSL